MILYRIYQGGGRTVEDYSNPFSGPGWANILGTGEKQNSAWDSIKNLITDTDWEQALAGGTMFAANPAERSRLLGNALDATFGVLETPYRWIAGARSDQPYTFEDFYTGAMPEDIDDNFGESIAYDPMTYVGAGLAKKGVQKLIPKAVKEFTPDVVKKGAKRVVKPKHAIGASAATGAVTGAWGGGGADW
jgi:hypothetical protein